MTRVMMVHRAAKRAANTSLRILVSDMMIAPLKVVGKFLLAFSTELYFNHI